MKLVLISDTHFRHDAIDVPDGDLLIHGGDFTARGNLEDVEQFNDWLGSLPHRHKIVVAGNHDFCFERQPEAARAHLTNGIYLEDETVTVDNVKIYGSPWQPWFCDWAFNLPRGEALRRKWELIPQDTEILVTHTPPHGVCDLTAGGEHTGCVELIEAVKRVSPRLHVFGHIHETAGTEQIADTTFVNASICNLRYQPVNAPVCLEI